MSDETAVVENPYGLAPQAPAQREAAVEVATQRELAEVQGAVLMARRFPRDERQAMDRILNACTRPSLAQAALYSYSRGGTDITGPSIRLAEVLAQCWGNLSFGIREVEQRAFAGRPGESTMASFCWDMETNVRDERVFQVKHERHTRSGSSRLTDPRDVYEAVANQGARRLRACILAVIPGDVVERAVEQCEATLLAKADTSPEAVAKLAKAFEQFGVTREQIEQRIQRRIDAIRPAQIVQLRKVWASLNDGMSVASDWFQAKQAEGEPEPEAKGNDGLKAKLSRPQAGTPAQAASVPADDLPPHEAATPVYEPGTAMELGTRPTGEGTSAAQHSDDMQHAGEDDVPPRPQSGARTAAPAKPTPASATRASTGSPGQTASGPPAPAEPSSDGELPLREPGEEG
jgi:hypothetical protein